jgi:hypothetical protein
MEMMMMATTKIWAIKDSLSRVVNYAENPEKTIFSDLKQVLKYTENDEKTIDKNEKMMFVTGVNCNRETAYEEMKRTQEKFDKCTGNVAYHAYQSFKTGEVTPELAHQIGVKLARKMWGEYQVIVATHFNTGTYHNHFVVNSVNMFTGKKFNCNKKAYYHFRDLSDELCAENSLTVIKNPKGKTPRNIYFAEKRGEPTKYNLMRKAIDEAMEMCISYAQFKKIMYKKGYIINDDYNRKYPTIRSKNEKKATRMYQLGEEYLPKNISDKVNQNPYYYQDRYLKFIKPRQQIKQYKKYKYKGNFKSISKMSGIEMLFVALFYFMGLLPKERPHYKPLSPEMKQEVRKMERYSNQIRLTIKEKLNTTEDVKRYISQTEDNIADVTSIRQKYRNKLRNCTDPDLINEYKSKRDSCTSILKDYRKNLKVANQILEDIPEIKKVIDIEKQMQKEEQVITKNKKRDRGGR